MDNRGGRDFLPFGRTSPEHLCGGSSRTACCDSLPVAIHFSGVIGDRPFACGQSYDGIGLSKARITPQDFRFYVSAVALIDGDGVAVPVNLEQDGVWQQQNVALLSFEDGAGPCANGPSEMRDVVVGSVPPGPYSGLQFTLGVPFELNPRTPPSLMRR